MHRVRAFIRRVPVGPVIIALLMVGVLALVNFYGTDGAAEQAAPSEPVVGIPPQLPAEEHAMPSPAATTDGPPAVVVPVPAPSETPAVPSTAPSAGGTIASPMSTPAATGGSGASGSGASAAPPAGTRPPATQGPGFSTQPPGKVPGTDDDDDDVAPVSARMRVVSVVLTSDHGPGAQIRCNDREEVVIAATIMVDGGQGDIVYQWFFENARAWPPDQLHFTGTGPRQQSLQIPWPVGLRFDGTRVRGTVQLRILQPAVYAQTRAITIDVVCV
ncbi:hypothetical protein [Streptodolium elevatio]|uniref:Uncharacterized protein n=1 Tax=Streptodolium elevatio TaxID=3157996 RepID=A0ABV3D8K7_9ACTN